MKISALFAVTVFLAVRPLSASDTGVVGVWRGPENSVISIAPCGGSLCAKVLSTGNETNARIDTNNPNASLRTRPICGLQIGEGFHGSDPNKAEGGHLYDPRSGKTYKGSMISEGDVLLLRGYVGMSMFGRTARWERVTAPVNTCKVEAGPATTKPLPAAPPATEPVPESPAPAPAASPSPSAAPPVAAPAPATPPPVPTPPATPPVPTPPAASPAAPAKAGAGDQPR